jgi:ABC-2 type transport system permease protein
MSTMTETRTAPTRSSAGLRGVTFGGVLQSEWIKLWSLLSTRILLLLTLVAIVGVGALAVLIRYT